MLVLIFDLAGERFGLDVQQVVRALPLVRLHAPVGWPPAVCGVLDYGGAAVPVIDLAELVAGQPCRRAVSTRILLVQIREGGTLGLMVDRVHETSRVDAGQLMDRPSLATSPLLGKVGHTASGLIHLIDVAQPLGPILSGWRAPEAPSCP